MKRFLPSIFLLLLSPPLLAVQFGPHLSALRKIAGAPGVLPRVPPLSLVAVGRDQELWRLRLKGYGIEVREVLGVLRLDLEPSLLPLLEGEEEVRVDLGARLYPLLDLSVPAMGVTEAVRESLPPADLIVAIVDTGIDLRHPDFLNPDGSTRFVAYWDQTYPEGSTTGTVCDALMIDEGECPNFPERPIGTILPLGHGTHVAGIAGGNHVQYRGVVPNALLVGVRIRFDEAGLVDALGWLYELAQRWQKPMVVNLSLGSNEGPHDGSFPSEIAIDHFSGPGRVVVAAAGNEATGPGGIHVRFPSEGGIQGARFEFSGRSGEESHFELWTDRGATFEYLIALEEFSGGGIGRILSKTPWLTPSVSTEVTLSERGVSAVDLMITPQETSTAVGISGTLKKKSKDLRSYRYQIWVRNLSAPLDAWLPDRDLRFSDTTGPVTLTLDPSGSETVRFVPGDSRYTLTLPGTARRVLTATGYVTRNEWFSRDGTHLMTLRPIGSLIDVASQGPTRDGREKPDLALPGEYIASSLSTQLEFFPADFRVDETHGLLRGTSMATPHLAGAVALLLMKRPDLTPEEILAFFQQWAIPRGERTLWGWGQLDLSPLKDLPAERPRDETPPKLGSLSARYTSGGWVIEFTSTELARAQILFDGGKDLGTLRYGERHRFKGKGSPPSRGFRIRLVDPAGNTRLSEPQTFPPPGCGCFLDPGKGWREPGGFLFLFFLLGAYRFLRTRRFL